MAAAQTLSLLDNPSQHRVAQVVFRRRARGSCPSFVTFWVCSFGHCFCVRRAGRRDQGGGRRSRGGGGGQTVRSVLLPCRAALLCVRACAGAGSVTGKLDVMVANAGVQFISPLIDVPFAEWRKMVLLLRHCSGSCVSNVRACPLCGAACGTHGRGVPVHPCCHARHGEEDDERFVVGAEPNRCEPWRTSFVRCQARSS